MCIVRVFITVLLCFLSHEYECFHTLFSSNTDVISLNDDDELTGRGINTCTYISSTSHLLIYSSWYISLVQCFYTLGWLIVKGPVMITINPHHTLLMLIHPCRCSSCLVFKLKNRFAVEWCFENFVFRRWISLSKPKWRKCWAVKTAAVIVGVSDRVSLSIHASRWITTPVPTKRYLCIRYFHPIYILLHNVSLPSLRFPLLFSYFV